MKLDYCNSLQMCHRIHVASSK